MKNIIWVILGVIVIGLILFMRKDGTMNGQENTVIFDKVYVDQSGKELKAFSKSDSKNADITFETIGTVSLTSEKPTLSGVEYKNADGSIVFWDKGALATLYQNGEVVFDGQLKDSNQ